MNLREYFENNDKGNAIQKWLHYFDIYERHFDKFVGKKIKVLEIGVWQGGSVKMWKEYFGGKAEIVGADIYAKCKNFEEDRIKIYIGDQANLKFLNEIIEKEGEFDVIIDDGGHYPKQQIISFNTLFWSLKEGGVYLCEDLHTNYWHEYMGGYKKPTTFIEFSKNLIDNMNAYLADNTNIPVDEYTKSIDGIHYYDSVVVFDKKTRSKPEEKIIGIRTV